MFSNGKVEPHRGASLLYMVGGARTHRFKRP